MAAGRWRAGLAGAVAAAVALGVAELAAAVLPGGGSLVVAVGDVVVALVPGALTRWAIDLLGTADKPVLVAGIVVVTGLFGAALGLLAAVRPRPDAVAAAGVAAVALLGVAAAGATGRSLPAATVGGAVAAVAGAVTLTLLLGAAGRAERAGAAGPVLPDVGGQPGSDRRSFLRLAAVAAAVAAGSATLARWLGLRSAVAQARAGVALPQPRRRAPAAPAGADLGVPATARWVTPNDRFYRIDTALAVPRVEVATWRLRITGMVQRELELTFEELLAAADVEHWTTLCCVSNEVGGALIGNARWQGASLRALLDRAGVRDGATQVVGRAVDGWTAGFPTAVLDDSRLALVAVGMNGEALPLEHGFPARLVVPGLYGYVSATKWLTELELTTWEAFDAYWVPRGWSKEGPVKTQSRIDTPRPGARLAAGPVTVAGVAWAQHRGVDRVEVSIDGGPWHAAQLGAAVNVDTWRQWRWTWQAAPGRHRLGVRATDGEGEVQTARRQGPAPDGATGHHTVAVTVA